MVPPGRRRGSGRSCPACSNAKLPLKSVVGGEGADRRNRESCSPPMPPPARRRSRPRSGRGPTTAFHTLRTQLKVTVRGAPCPVADILPHRERDAFPARRAPARSGTLRIRGTGGGRLARGRLVRRARARTGSVPRSPASATRGRSRCWRSSATSTRSAWSSPTSTRRASLTSRRSEAGIRRSWSASASRCRGATARSRAWSGASRSTCSRRTSARRSSRCARCTSTSAPPTATPPRS